MKRSILSWSKEVAVIAIIVITITNLVSFLRKPDIKNRNLPNFKLTTIDKKIISLEEYRGKPLLIHFWATWCMACKLEASNIEKVSKNWQVLTVAVDSGSNYELKEFLKNRGLTYDVINDKDGKLAKSFSISIFPTTFIYDKNLEISFIDVGYTSTLSLKIKMWLSR